MKQNIHIHNSILSGAIEIESELKHPSIMITKPEAVFGHRIYRDAIDNRPSLVLTIEDLPVYITEENLKELIHEAQDALVDLVSQRDCEEAC